MAKRKAKPMLGVAAVNPIIRQKSPSMAKKFLKTFPKEDFTPIAYKKLKQASKRKVK